MKKLALILFMGTLVSFMPMPGANPVLVRKGGSHTVRQAANLSVMMVLLVHRKKHALTEV
ncbi:Uncharacterised protein [Escherichia coli]|uniref:Uncharacterized protein n=1 Tax=Escherichia coli TaxID=562 RepID=A0A2X1PW34_ECOLX|nr:Uncharacterised protein [Escherichia coli]